MTAEITVPSYFIKGAFDLIKEWVQHNDQSIYDVENNLKYHLTEVAGWSENIPLYELGGIKKTDLSTVELQISIPRKFRKVSHNKETQDEISLLKDLRHHFLLGDPGAGKTTTLKRLARKILFESPYSDDDILQYPIVIRLREIDKNISLYNVIAKILGLSVEIRETERTFGQKIIEYYISDKPIESVIIEILNTSSPLLLLDGFDEIKSENIELFSKEIKKLSYQLNNCKMIVSCRSGGYYRQFGAFNVIEICPLDNHQIEEVANKWADEPERFLTYLNATPYYDLANRPLFLINLIVLFNRYNYLPEQPSQVYKKIVNILLEKWDEDKGVKRRSRYSNFDVDRKREFLSSLSYYLTFVIRTNIFSTELLIQAYKEICQSFNLPEKEATKVAQEIETHTGIIIESFSDQFEFSHLSIQEYLCADYILRAPIPESTSSYLKEIPEVIAITVALSSKPTDWLCVLLSCADVSINYIPFIKRLTIERPFFRPANELGFALMKMIFSLKDEKHSEDLIKLHGAKESLGKIFYSNCMYDKDISNPDFLAVDLTNPLKKDEKAIHGTFPVKLYKEIKSYIRSNSI